MVALPITSSISLSEFFFLRFYVFIHEKQREAETQAEGEADAPRGARCGTRSQDRDLSQRQTLNH